MRTAFNGWPGDSLHVRIFVANVETIGAEWRHDFPRIGHWRLYWNDIDGAYLDMETGPFAIPARRAVIVPVGSTFRTRTERPVRHFYVHFDLIGLPNVAIRHLFAQPIVAPAVAGLAHITEEVAQEVASAPDVSLPALWRAKAVVYEALGQYLRTVAPEEIERCWQVASAMEPVARALRHIEQYPSEPLRNAELSRLCLMNEDHFIRKFRQCVGQTPGEYITDRRVALASQRLLFSNQTIDQIAEETGFCNRSHFTRVFKRLKGVAPAAYRRAAAK